MKKLLLIVLMSWAGISLAQKITFKLENSATLQPIEGASLKSYLDTSLHVRSDKYGHVTVHLKENDTLTFIKDYFHPIYLYVKVKNFDSTHVISINMVPSRQVHEPVKKNFGSLNDFNYHFVHDQVSEDSHVKISTFEHVDATKVRKLSTDTLNHNSKVYVVPNLHLYKGKPQYKLK